MIPGFNHNIKHKGRIYHIQTEDSGPKNPHIITHLFVGGNILSSKKTPYSDIVGKPDYEKTVRSMMEEQHKQMLRNLVNGVFDNVETGTAYHLDGPAPMNFTATSPTTSAMAGSDAFRGLPSQAKPGDATTTQGALPAPAAAIDFIRPAGGIPVAATPPSAPPTPVMDEKKPLPPGTIFGEDLISEKSLDEVILSYLAEDLAEKE
jgi:hypothetical protein